METPRLSPDEIIMQLFGAAWVFDQAELAPHVSQVMYGALNQSINETPGDYLIRLRRYFAELERAIVDIDAFEGNASDTARETARDKLRERLIRVRAVIDSRTRSRDIAAI